MQFFVEEHSIVRTIWGKSDTVLFIFAGSAAEFALNKAVDWLYYTGKLPADPLGRLFSTVEYARKIVFAPLTEAHQAIDVLRKIHGAVEANRGFAIPDWAYRDVLFMLIHYSIASYELLQDKLSLSQKEEVYNVFYKVGSRMGLQELPLTYTDWLPVRIKHLEQNLERSRLTTDLFLQYKKHLGSFRYKVLIEGQKLVLPPQVKKLLQFKNASLLAPILPLYKLSRFLKIDGLIKSLLFPSAYKEQIRQLDITETK